MGRVHRLSLAGVTIAAAVLLTLAGCAGSCPRPAAGRQRPAPGPTREPTPAPDPVRPAPGRRRRRGGVRLVGARHANPRTYAGSRGAGVPGRGRTRSTLILSHYVNYRMTGSTLDDLTVDCTPILKSEFNADPAQYLDSSWIAATHTDGDTIYAVVHHEYRGHTHPGVCPTKSYADCLDTSSDAHVFNRWRCALRRRPSRRQATTWPACRSHTRRARAPSASARRAT